MYRGIRGTAEILGENSLSSYFRGIGYKQFQLPYNLHVCLSISHGIMTICFCMTYFTCFPTKFMNVFQFNNSNI